jgi:secreted trypsin-like serine protease
MNLSITNLLLSLVLMNSSVFSVLAQGEDGPQKIVGGELVQPNKYPWFTMLMYVSGNQQIRQGCGGMLVSSEYVLTAAHCIDSDMRNNGAVRVGAFRPPYQPTNNGGQPLEFIRLDRVITHPDYNSRSLDNDYALLRLDTASSITPVPLDKNSLSNSYPSGEKYISDSFYI